MGSIATIKTPVHDIIINRGDKKLVKQRSLKKDDSKRGVSYI